MSKQAILVISFGTSHQDTLQQTIQAVEEDIRFAYPGWQVRRAFTSGMILRRLRERDNLVIDTVPEALERLLADGFDTVICQPTHILNGEEFDDILEASRLFQGRFSRFIVSAPLLSNTDDYRQLAQGLIRHFPAEPDCAICLMGHGSRHFADSAYAALDYHLKALGRSDMFVGTVEGYPDLDTLLRKVDEFSVSKVVLTPLMLVAGDHAKHDMAGDGTSSWKVVFEQSGYQVRCVVKGLGEYPDIRKMYVDHVAEAIRRLNQ